MRGYSVSARAVMLFPHFIAVKWSNGIAYKTLEQQSMKGRKNKNTPHQVEDSVGSVGKFSPQGARCERD
jgi:hypothetical protein